MNRITIFHYHLLPGGVTNVMQLGAAALIRHYPDLQLIRLVCGKKENTDTLRKKLEKEIDFNGLIADSLRFEICIEPDIDYKDSTCMVGSEETSRLVKKLLESYGDSMWWIHNYQLGKNPLFTAAVMQIAKAIPEQKMLLHIHDFPECARYDNLAALSAAGVMNPYPISSSTAYALINGRDRDILKAAGIPANKLYLLNNPVEDDSTQLPKLPAADAERLKKNLYSYYSKSFPAVKPDGKLIFYPVRTIRRKNALEAGLIAAVSEQPVNLVLSLPGVSVQEKKYSDICEQCFKDGLIPGIWGSGTDNAPEVPSYPQMLQLSDGILSSSVQEGFGYLFINSVQLGIPLIARDLDILDGIRNVFPENHTSFYNSFLIPCSRSEAEALKNSYRDKIKKLNALSKSSIDKIASRIENFGTEGYIDFSFISVENQFELLKKTAASNELKKEIHLLNEILMESIYDKLDSGKYETDRNMSEFSLKSHSKTIEKIIKDLYSSTGLHKFEDKQIQDRLLEIFAEPQYMRLLYDF